MANDGTEHHLEHAEHAHHAAFNPFDRKVATSMAMIAAVLAGVTLLSHRGHNDTLRLQTEANIDHTKASDMWGFYQAKNIRNHEYQADLRLVSFLAVAPGADSARDEAIRYWTSQVEKSEGKKGTAENGGDPGELAEIKREAEALQTEAKAKEHESHAIHQSVNWIDVGHLGLELALVLCSVAVLTKLRGFWFAGLCVAVAGVALALFGVYAMFLMPH
jgi:Domain of unknown function (DUF4337)